jgi:hypothetical protein
MTWKDCGHLGATPSSSFRQSFEPESMFFDIRTPDRMPDKKISGMTWKNLRHDVEGPWPFGRRPPNSSFRQSFEPESMFSCVLVPRPPA